MTIMTVETLRFNASELCSRKLWQLINADNHISTSQLEEAISELATRRHYLAELAQMGKLEGKLPEA